MDVVNEPPTWLTSTASGVRLTIAVQPRSKRTEVVGEHGDALKIRVAAPPVDGKANKALLAFLASTLDVSQSALTLHSGEAARRKVVGVEGVDASVVVEALLG